MSLADYAKVELEFAGMFDKDSDYDGMLGNAVMELIECFAKQGHSGCSAGMTISLFSKLADYKPLIPLTFKDEEWNDTGRGFQNKRNYAVFKESKDSKPYYGDAYYKKTQTGSTWGGSLTVGDGKRLGLCYIKDPSKMPKICIDIIDWEVNKETGEKETGSGWWLHKMKDPSQLKELAKYYDFKFIDETKESK